MSKAKDQETQMISHRLSVAPMMGYTDRHARFLMRLLTRHTMLYTEMITSGAIKHGDKDRLLAFNQAEHPLALQVGGHDPDEMAISARSAEEKGFDEVNINVGCPSSRVRSGRIGACLMAEPKTVANCVKAMRKACELPVTVKCRTGIDSQDSFDSLLDFIQCVSYAGCKTFIIHARKAWLEGISPKQNRDLPPLCYDKVYRVKQVLPELEIIINGGIKTFDQIDAHLHYADGVMIGRAAYHDPWMLASADSRLFNDKDAMSNREQVILGYLPYVEAQLTQGEPLMRMARHLTGLVLNQPGARNFRRYLSEHGHVQSAGPEVIERALAFIVPEKIAA
ncbi:MAG: tRNA dihydrouridine(20/20a) synthase DusA [Gammaproteobacteria bacterium]|nr:MAG: tRNA dihydrouridine(20/20a) synthase DusA [Gammaproteobacteria bacterium]